MSEQSLFIGRESEIAQIEKCIESRENTFIIALSSEGGIGKSRLLREVQKKYRTKAIRNFIIADIIDFDDLAFHIPSNVTRKIADMLDRVKFKPFLMSEIEYRDMQMRGYGYDRLAEERERMNKVFVDCFNNLSMKNRIVLFFDTTDKLEGKQDVWKDLQTKFEKMKNVTVIIAGRDAKKIVASLLIDRRDKIKRFIELDPFPKEDCRAYLQQRCKEKNIPNIESDFLEKVIFLTGGKPVLLDLAVEWRARGISLEWLTTKSLADLGKLSNKQKKERQTQVEKQLVSCHSCNVV